MGIADTDGWHAEFIIPGENTNQLAILFTIAHELGHLNWRNAWNKNPDPSACFKSLLGLSWSSTVDGNGVDARARPWTDYGDDVGLHKGSIPKPHQATPAKLRTIDKGGFITALAAANPEEDFVNSTMLISLVSSSQLYLKTPSSTDITITDVLRDTTDKKLDKKLKCVPDALQ